MEQMNDGGGSTEKEIKAPYQFNERMGGLGGFMPLKECERALFLTKQQMKVLTGIGYGYCASEIGMALGLSPKTIESHLAHIKDALELDSCWELRVWAVKYFMSLQAHQVAVRDLGKKRKEARREFVLCGKGPLPAPGN